MAKQSWTIHLEDNGTVFWWHEKLPEIIAASAVGEVFAAIVDASGTAAAIFNDAIITDAVVGDNGTTFHLSGGSI